MRVKELMTASPSVCRLGDSAADATRVMWERDCGAVPVVDADGHVAGIVTDRDICMAAFFQGVPIAAIEVSTIMSRDLCTCEEGEDVTAAEQRMRDRQVRRLPVLDGDSTLTGILSLSDVTQGVARVAGRQRDQDAQELLQTVTAVSTPRVKRSPAA